MTFFNTENQTMRLFGPESHRRKLTPENNRWQREAMEMREQQALLKSCSWCRGFYPERSYCHVCHGAGALKTNEGINE